MGRTTVCPDGTPSRDSSTLNMSPSRTKSRADWHFGSMVPNGLPCMTTARSAAASGVSSALMRTNSFGPADCAAKVTRQTSRAVDLRSGATESSRSRINASAAQSRALAIFRSLSPGTNSNDRMATMASEGSHAEETVVREGVIDALADKLLQRLGRAAAKRPVARSAVETRDWIVVGETVATMHLQGLARYADRHLIAVHLGDAGQIGVRERIGGGGRTVQN